MRKIVYRPTYLLYVAIHGHDIKQIVQCRGNVKCDWWKTLFSKCITNNNNYNISNNNDVTNRS